MSRQQRKGGRRWAHGITAFLWFSTAVSLAHGRSFVSAEEESGTRLKTGGHDALIAGTRLHYVVAGQGPLLMVCSPGWGLGSLYLQRGLAPLASQYTLVFLDTRGSGQSARPTAAQKMSGADMADDLEALRTYLGIKRLRLLGHSDSGSIVLDYAERYPSTISHLILVDGDVLGEGKPYREERAQRAARVNAWLENPAYQAAKKALNTPPPNTDEALLEWMKQITPVYFADQQRERTLWKDTAGTRPSAWAMSEHTKANAAYSWHQEEQLGNVRAASLIIVGKQDRICPPLIAEHVHQGIRHSQLIEIDGSGHFPWIEQPTQFFPAIGKFLQLP